MSCFSYGVVIWEILTSDVPHKDQGVGPLMEKAKSGQLALLTPESIPTLYKKLLQGKLTLKLRDTGFLRMLTLRPI